MRLYFIRHGQSTNNLRWLETGSSEGRVPDPELTDAGEQQAQVLADFVARHHTDVSPRDRAYDSTGRFQITHCYTSLMDRAVATGHKIAEAVDLPLLPWLDLHETGGMFSYDPEEDAYNPEPGMTRGHLAAHYPRLVLTHDVTEAGWWNRPFEPEAARVPRARRVLAELLTKHGGTDDEVIFVSHGGFFNLFLRAILGFDNGSAPPDGSVWFGAYNASMTRVDFSGEERFVAYINRTDYLPAHLIT
ncbi:MAG: histidine phosphatase family protein [Anaerolineae bacterium]|nr:histidine phosphatase family protein [Anaerolineae bacterium]